MADIDNSADILDSRDIEERIEELESERDAFEHDDDGNLTGASWGDSYPDEQLELTDLTALRDDVKPYCPDWEHGATLIRDSYFQEYAEQMADDLGAINSDVGWPNNCIDWERAARELQMDYTSVELNGVTYWVR